MSINNKILWTSTPSDGISTADYSYYGNESVIFMKEDNIYVDRFGGLFSGIFYCLIFTFSLAGNGLLFWALLKYENLQRASNVFLLNLTVSDLIFTIPLPFWAVYQLHQWVFGAVACKLLSGLFFVGFYTYITFLVILTADRYTGIVCDVMSWRTRRRHHIRLVCAAVWVACGIASLPEALFSDTRDSSNGTLCEAFDQSLHQQLVMCYIQITLFFLIPFMIITFCYLKIWTRIWKCKSKKKHQAVKLILGIIVGFFVCWAPYNITLFLSSLSKQEYAGLTGTQEKENLYYAYYVCHCLAYCHCCLNPFIHICGSEKFRTHISLMCKSQHRRQGLWSQTFNSQTESQKTSVSRQTYV